MRKIASLFLLLLIACSVKAQDITGSWTGKLDMGLVTLRLNFHIESGVDGLSATWDSIDQNAFGLKTTSTTFVSDTLRVRMDDARASYEGRIENDTIKGFFTQMGRALPLILTRGEIGVNRPQTPVPPYPYNVEEVVFRNESAGITLAGTLTLPSGTGKFPAVIMVTGSGPQNRDEEMMGHRPFHVIADYLTRKGIAVLRYDDRGTASSQGDYRSASVQDFATDAVAALEYLKTRNEVDFGKTGIIGHSEGGMIAVMVAGETRLPSFIVSLAGIGIPGDSLMREQRRLIMDASGAPQAAFEQNERLVERIVEVVHGLSFEEVKASVDSLVLEVVPPMFLQDAQTVQRLKGEVIRLASPEIRSIMAYDPAEDMKNIACHVLALNGSKDLQVPAGINLAGFTQHVNPQLLTTKEYEGLNHLFQHAQTGLLNEYSSIEETFAPEVLEDIANWILDISGR